MDFVRENQEESRESVAAESLMISNGSRRNYRSLVMSYAVSCLLVALAALARQLIAPVLGDLQPFPTFYVSVMIVAWWGGLGPSLLALVLGYLAADWFFITPRDALSALNIVNTGTYFFVGLAIALFAQMMHSAQDRAEAGAAKVRRRREELEREVAERRRVEQEREHLLEQPRAARDRLEAVLRQMPAGVVICEAPSGRILLANEQMHQIWQWPAATAQELAEHGVHGLRDQHGQPYLSHEWPLVRSLSTGEVIKNEEVKFPRGGTSWGTMLVSSSPIVDASGTIVATVAVLHDITARKQAEEELVRAYEELEGRVAKRTADLARANESLRAEVMERRAAEEARQELLRRLVKVQEEERVRIARELHDQMGQQLTALKLGLEALECPWRDDAARSEGLRRMLELTRQIGHDMHRIAWELGPWALQEFDLPTALSNYAEEWSGHSHIPVQLHCTGPWDGRLQPQVETTLYRIVQEALTNVAKHARATRLSLTLNRQEDQLFVVIEDDGLGFDAETAMTPGNQGQKLGLIGMKQRVEAVGGVFQIESAPGSGTTVFVHIAVTPERERPSDGKV